MGEGLFREEGGDVYEVFSAGTNPTQVRPEAIAVMREIGIEFADRPFEYVITVCDNARESCPFFPACTERLHWSLEDPAATHGSEEERLAAFRRIRDELRDRIRSFLSEHRGTG
jgi:arsenate reductase